MTGTQHAWFVTGTVGDRQVNLGVMHRIVGIVTQGGYAEGAHWVTSFHITYRNDGATYLEYMDPLTGNRKASSVSHTCNFKHQCLFFSTFAKIFRALRCTRAF